MINNINDWGGEWKLKPQGSATTGHWAREMAQLAKVHPSKPDNLTYISRTHMVEGDDRHLQVIFCPAHVSYGIYSLHFPQNK